jgi:hypothetical protein
MKNLIKKSPGDCNCFENTLQLYFSFILHAIWLEPYFQLPAKNANFFYLGRMQQQWHTWGAALFCHVT